MVSATLHSSPGSDKCDLAAQSILHYESKDPLRLARDHGTLLFAQHDFEAGIGRRVRGMKSLRQEKRRQRREVTTHAVRDRVTYHNSLR